MKYIVPIAFISIALASQSCSRYEHNSMESRSAPLSERDKVRVINYVKREFYGHNSFRGQNDRMLISPVVDGEVVFIYFMTAGSCGSGGCSLVALRVGSGELEAIGRTSRVQLPVSLIDERNFGYPSVEVSVFGGGIGPPQRRILRYDGNRYPRFSDDTSTARSNEDHSAQSILGNDTGEVILLH